METKKYLRRYLEERRMTVSQLSKRSGVPAKTIYHWLNGQKPGNVEYLFKVCEALEIKIETLFGKELEEKRSTVKINMDDLKTDLQLGSFEVILRPIKKASG